MIYLVENHFLHLATVKNLEQFVDLESNQLHSIYSENEVNLVAAWICSANTLFQITQIYELKFFEAAYKVFHALNDEHSYQDLKQQLNRLISETDWQFYQSAGRKFSEAFHRAVEESQSSPSKVYTVATLDLNRNKMPLFAPKQEAALDIGMPLVAFMQSITGRHDNVIDIWKGDLQAAGYQTQDYYDSLGMSEDWWNWMRDIAPGEKLLRVNMLPYSPLQ